jgi:hypothetical protein
MGEEFAARPAQEEPMTGSTRTIQGTPNFGQLAVALVAIAIGLALAAAVALGQLNPSKAQTAPAVDAAPIVVDRGAMEGAENAPAVGSAPNIIDRGEMEGPAKAPSAADHPGGWGGVRQGTGTGGSNGTRLAQ